MCRERLAFRGTHPPRNFRSPYYRIQVCLPETRVTEHTLPGPREASVQRPEPGEFQESASRNISFSVLEKPPFRDTDP